MYLLEENKMGVWYTSVLDFVPLFSVYESVFTRFESAFMMPHKREDHL